MYQQSLKLCYNVTEKKHLNNTHLINVTLWVVVKKAGE